MWPWISICQGHAVDHINKRQRFTIIISRRSQSYYFPLLCSTLPIHPPSEILKSLTLPIARICHLLGTSIIVLGCPQSPLMISSSVQPHSPCPFLLGSLFTKQFLIFIPVFPDKCACAGKQPAPKGNIL